MKFQVFSDIHLEFAPWNHPVEGGNVAVLAGDVFVANSIFRGPNSEKYQTLVPRYEAMIRSLLENFDHIVHINGNHEHYHGDINDTSHILLKFVKDLGVGDRFHHLEKEVFVCDGVAFLGTTLWSNLSDPLVKLDAKHGMNDYQIIYNRASTGAYRSYSSRLSPDDTHFIFTQSLNWLKEELTKTDDGIRGRVVVTHHAPSFESISETYRGHHLNDCYASNLHDLIHQAGDKLKFWCHGHVHCSNDYWIGKTRVISNPRGYPHAGENVFENHSFDSNLVFEV